MNSTLQDYHTGTKTSSALFLFILFFVTLLSGCAGLKDSPKFKFDDGVYLTKINNQKQHVYIENTNDSIAVYSLKKGWHRLPPTTVKPLKSYTLKNTGKEAGSHKYWQNSFDIDFMTIPIKFRPSTQSFPKQFSNNVNGILYLGYRNDTYRLSYKTNPVGKISQKIAHFGISGGFITGFGATAMNPWVTNNQISIEYDGLIWSKGVAVVMGVNKFTFGLIGAIDHLLDKNKDFWIYQGKPYLGLAVGLNLN
ncbi:hypothetical protein ACFP1I_31560 [Dyadobacter subterraneus]|uniref:Lipoprotein n=1 Tax=Dyadobacter subterraneus TaxID=2773304 RepID=A0ABR9W8P9_9BACT|nr:hypothetical protein [Dyadobacter subterraneus]MBE9461858.1 hypothetical protein [Dyadobacter subterraneus]